MKEVLIIDNYDSFTYNLVHYLEGLGTKVIICRNNEINWELVKSSKNILLSPGPGLPKEAGDLLQLIHRFHREKNILGICLGHQAIAQYFNNELENINPVMHGKSSKLLVKDDSYLFKGLPTSFTIGHYHSWVVKLKSNSELITTAVNEHGMNMGFRHKNWQLFGLQFHPESILTENGRPILNNWIKTCS